MEFFVIPPKGGVPRAGVNRVYLQIDKWNDFSFVTQFYLSFHDEKGVLHEIGRLKIGFKGQTTETDTHSKLPQNFPKLDGIFFSLGQDIDFYKKMYELEGSGRKILTALCDIVSYPELINDVREEDVFSKSLLREVNLSTIKGQYARVLTGDNELTNYDFKFMRPSKEQFGAIDLSFEVEVGSMPSTNLHAVISRNGVGKTTLLNSMVDAISSRDNSDGRFLEVTPWGDVAIDEAYFSSLVSVSFSAFDSFAHPPEQPDPAKGTCYFYIGLIDPENGDKRRSLSDLRGDCIHALTRCFHDSKKTELWLNAINKLGSDENFSHMNLTSLEGTFRTLLEERKAGLQSDSTEFYMQYLERVHPILEPMSSGHAIVLLIITRLVATVEEKTLVLLDEPESHLHPPLLSAFVRALSELLLDRNGVGIIATHSPVILQEIPRSCVWKMYRRGDDVQCSRPKIETFAENVGVLTSEVFSLEVEESGFHDILSKSVDTDRSYKEILSDFDNKMGFEGRAILKAMVANRDRGGENDKTR